MDTKSDLWGIISLLKKVILGSFITIILIIAGFIIYLVWGNHSASIDTTGVYNLVDSEGNVIATDLTPEDINNIMEFLNGKDTSN